MSIIYLFRFRHLEKSFPDQVRELSTFFRFHAASIEMERMNLMTDTQMTAHYKDWLCRHFDVQIHQVNIHSTKYTHLMFCNVFLPKLLISNQLFLMALSFNAVYSLPKCSVNYVFKFNFV